MSRARIKPVRAYTSWAWFDTRTGLMKLSAARNRATAEVLAHEHELALRVRIIPVPRRRAKKSRRKDK